MTTRALHAYYSTHAAPGPHHLDTLAGLIGLQASNGKRNRDALIKAHTALKDAGFLADFEVMEDSVRVQFGSGHSGPVPGREMPRRPGLGL